MEAEAARTIPQWRSSLLGENVLEKGLHVLVRLIRSGFVVLERHSLAQASIVLRRRLFRRHVNDRAVVGLGIAAGYRGGVMWEIDRLPQIRLSNR